MIDFNMYKSYLENTYELGDNWEEELKEVYESPEDFVSNYETDVIDAIASDALRIKRDKYDSITMEVKTKFKTPDGVTFSNKTSAIEHFDWLESIQLDDIDSLITSLSICADDMRYRDIKECTYVLRNIKANVNSGEGVVPVDSKLSKLLNKSSIKKSKTVKTNIYAKGWWYIVGTGFTYNEEE